MLTKYAAIHLAVRQLITYFKSQIKVHFYTVSAWLCNVPRVPRLVYKSHNVILCIFTSAKEVRFCRFLFVCLFVCVSHR